MKLPVRLTFFGFILAAVVSLLFVGSQVQAQVTDLSEDQLGRISANCTSAKSTLSQLHASDALLRVNRGQLYETINTRLMNSFNSRLSNNSLDNKGLVLITGSYRGALETFRKDYTAYEQQLSSTMKIDCAKRPSDFYYALMDAREKRATVYQDVLKLHQYIDDYRSGVNDFYINYQRVLGGEE